MKDKLLQIINHYGVMKQLKYIHSEYFELDEAILNFRPSWYYGEETEETIKDRNHITEELADVMVMLKQFQYYYGISNDEILDIMNEKIDRQLERIKEEK